MDETFFRSRIAEGCWTWTGPQSHNGYGRYVKDGIDAPAHRVAYEHFIGPIPVGFQIDHKCRNRACVNPAHLEAVSPEENTRRRSAVVGKRTHCWRGHRLTPENLVRAGTGRRQCRVCYDAARERGRERRNARQRERYRNDPEFREKRRARSAADHRRKIARVA